MAREVFQKLPDNPHKLFASPSAKRHMIYVSMSGLPLINTLNAELNPICPLLALSGAHHILHVSR